MPEERIYQSRVDPRAAAPMPLASPEVYGAGIGRAVEQLGGTLHETKLRAYQLERDQKAGQEAADLASRMAAQRLENDKAITDLRMHAKPGAAGHAEAVQELLKRQREALAAEPIVEARTRQQALSRFDEYSAQVVSGEYQYQQGHAVGKRVKDEQQAIDTMRNINRTSTDPEVLPRELNIRLDEIHSAPDLSDDLKEQLATEATQQAFAGSLDGMLDRGQPQMVKAQIDSGMLNHVFTPEQLDHYRNAADVEIRRQDAATEHQAQLQIKADTDELASIKSDFTAGVTVDPQRLNGLMARAAARGDESAASQIRVLSVQATIKPWTDVATPQQVDDEINGLAGLKDPTPEQEIRLQALRQARPGVIERYTNRPGEWAANNGDPPPTLNPADRASVTTYANWRSRVTAQTGHDPGFPPANIQLWREEAKGGAAKRIQLASELQAMPPSMRTEIARTLDPNDRLLQHVVTLENARARELALLGPDALRANPALLKPAEARLDFNDYVGASLNGLSPEFRANVQDTAINIYAATMAQHGKGEYDRASFQRSIDAAMQGHITVWNGARVIVPPDLGGDGFATRLSRWTGQLPPGAANGAPVSASGGQVTAGYIRQQLIPRMVGDGRYMFIDASGSPLRLADGRPWQVNIRALPLAKLEKPKSASAQQAMPAIADLPHPGGQQAVWGPQ